MRHTSHTSHARHTRPVRLTALAAALIVGPAVLTATPAQAAIGTPVTDTSYAFTAQLQIGSGDQMRGCSGALIDPNWIVTAASCFAASPLQGGAVAAGAPALKTVATIGRADLTATTGGHVTEVTELVPRAGRDLVLARLATPATGIQPVAMASTPAAAGDALKVAGYGRTKTQWVPDRLHVASFDVNTADAASLAITGRTADDAICMGDSGGPVLRERNGAVELVGVSSRSWQGGCFGVTETRNGAVAARTDGVATGSRLAAGQRLLPGDTLASAAATLTMRADGNLVVTTKAGKALWSTNTAGNAGATALFGADGNLVVRNAADTATLWQSGTAAASGSVVLQERGNLVVYNAQGQSQWTTGTAVRNDFDGNGKADMVDWYDYADGHDAMHLFGGSDTGAITAPRTAFTTPAGNWYHDNMKKVSGDFNGDGRADVAVFYGYSDGAVKLWTFLGRPDGTFATPFSSWSVAPGNWTFSRVRLHSGDFNGDGRDDVVAWYDYADGHDALFTFLSDTRGAFATPFSGWSAPTGSWTANNAKYVTGDFNGDGRDDLGALYRYSDTAVKLWLFTATPAGGFTAKQAWSSDTWGALDRTGVHAGDFDGDGRDDVGLWYDYVDGHDAFQVLKGRADGTVGTPSVALNAKAGDLTAAQMKIVIGDYNGDGRDDLATMYGYTDGSVKMFTWPALAGGALGTVQTGWSTATGWTFARVNFVNRYTNS
ncbi:FG-GAP-like repeat-containing protein [Streptomyces vilmorinianum]|uniref:FG-GAP-like repeat-containing protein n=1 Tax=Streptomyces vilmorinianum TaxID=3051092 RepID=UPI0010FB6EA2|nr:FG-GAP-like repeat-containing protein [Streptomyces vilmorinianum]